MKKMMILMAERYDFWVPLNVEAAYRRAVWRARTGIQQLARRLGITPPLRIKPRNRGEHHV